MVAGERLEPRALLTVSVPPDITGDTVEIDDNVLVAQPGGSITATGGTNTSGHVQIFGNSKGRIDGTPGQLDEDLTITADRFITVTGGIGGIQRIDDLTLRSETAQPINLQQMVSLTGDLRVTKAGAFTVGSTVTVDGDLIIDQADMVTFAGNVTVGGNLMITNATGVTFAGMLTVGGALTITNSTGATRFGGDVLVGAASITSTTLVQVQADFTTTGVVGDGDVTFTTDQISLATATLGADSTATGATLVVQPRTASRALTIASPPGIPAGLTITDADLTAIQPGWKRVVFGDEAAGTGTVKIGSIGSQYGGFSQILNTTTIVGGTVQVVQPVDVTPLAIYLELIARGTGSSGSGAVTIDAPINQTAGERSAWVRFSSAGSIGINAPVWADQIVSLTTTAGGAIAQGGTIAAITAPALAVDSDGGVTLADSGNAFGSVAIKTTNDSLVLRDDSGYVISPITTIDDGRDSRPTATVTGIDVGTGTVRLVTISGATMSLVDQSRAILAGAVGLEGTRTSWNLSLVGNDIGTLAANTGSIVFRDIDDLTIGTVAAVTPQSELSGITVERTLRATAGTTLAITAAGDIISAASSGTAVNLEAPSGISTAGDVITAGGNVDFDHATTLTGDVVLDLEDGPARGLATFADAVDGTTAGQESLTIGGDLDTSASFGSTTALQSLSVSGDSTLAGGITLRTTGNQTYSGAATSTGTITIQAGSGSTVGFLGKTTLGGLVTATADTAAYGVALTGSSISVTNAVTFANSGTVTLGNAVTDSLTFVGGLTSTAPATTNLAGTIATTSSNATFGVTALTAESTVSTAAGNAYFQGTVNGPFALSVNSQGTTAFGGAVGDVAPLAALVTDAGGTTRISGGRITTTEPLVMGSVPGDDLGVLVNSGQFYNDAVELGANTVLTAGLLTITPSVAVVGDEITFASTVDGAYSLTVNTRGATEFNGNVGATRPLASLITDTGGMTLIQADSITTSGSQTYADDTTLVLPPLATASISSVTVPQTLLTGSTVSLLQGLDAGYKSLRIEGNAVFGDQPGARLSLDYVDPVHNLDSLTVTGSTTINSNAVLANSFLHPNPITFQGPVSLGSSVIVGGTNIEFGSQISGSGRDLFVLATDSTSLPSIAFRGDVGTPAAPLGGLLAGCEFGTVQINAAIYATEVTVVGGSIDGNANNSIHTPAGTIKLLAMNGIGVTTPIAVEAASVSANGGMGDIRLRGIGDLVVGTDGLIASAGAIGLTASGQIRVPGGRTIEAANGVTTNTPIRWGLLGTADSGAGSLRDVIGKANATRAPGIVEFGNTPATFTLQSQLPDITTSLVMNGGNLVTISGNSRVLNGLTYVAGSAGSRLSGVSLRGFGNFGIRLQGASGVTIEDVRVTSLNTFQSMGLYATGDLTGTRILSSQFSGGLRGALLSGARNLAFGAIGQGNTFSNNRSVPNSRFAGTGIRAQGNCQGTVVEGNTFTRNNYGFAFVNAQNLRLTNNRFFSNNTAAIFFEGNNAGSVAVRNTFGVGAQRNARVSQRVQGATGG